MVFGVATHSWTGLDADWPRRRVAGAHVTSGVRVLLEAVLTAQVARPRGALWV